MDLLNKDVPPKRLCRLVLKACLGLDNLNVGEHDYIDNGNLTPKDRNTTAPFIKSIFIILLKLSDKLNLLMYSTN